MTNNDILRRLRYALTLNNDALQTIFAQGNLAVSHQQLHVWLLKEEEEGCELCPDSALSQFLDGLIIARRGARPDAPAQEIPNRINNNLVLRKLRIALNFKEEDMLATFACANFKLSKSELSSFFRAKGQKNYQDCGDQILRNFLLGLTAKYRPS
ncbi:MAG: DUF1456 family protein [Aeromonas sp.]